MRQKPKENKGYKKSDPQISEYRRPSQNNCIEKPDQYEVPQKPDRRNNKYKNNNDQNLNIKENGDIINISDSSNDSNSIPTLSNFNKTDIINSVVTKQAVVMCDGIVDQIFKHVHVLNTVNKQPVVLVEDTLSRLLSKETYAKKKSYIEHDDSLAEIIKINGKQDNNESFQNVTQNECNNVDNIEIATIQKVQADKLENVAIMKPFYIEDSDCEIVPGNLRNKLIFEDDEDDEYDEDDLISFGNFENNINLPGANNMDPYEGKMLLGTRVTETYSPSVHYDDLIENNILNCRLCGQISSNR